MKKLFIITALIFLCLMFLYNATFADIYKYVDDKGQLRLTNVPKNPNYKYTLILREKIIDQKDDVIGTDWIHYGSIAIGDVYYRKSSIKKINKNNIRVWTETIYNEDGKKEKLLNLGRIGKSPDNPDILSHELMLYEIDCVNDKFNIPTATVYDEKGNVVISRNYIYQWEYIVPESIAETLKNKVCSTDKTSKTKKK